MVERVGMIYQICRGLCREIRNVLVTVADLNGKIPNELSYRFQLERSLTAGSESQFRTGRPAQSFQWIIKLV